MQTERHMPEKRFSEKRNSTNKNVLTLEKWQTTLILLSNDTDYNIKQTIVNDAELQKHNTKKDDVENIWKRRISFSIGEVLKSNEKFDVECTIVRYGQLQESHTATIFGNSIINHFWDRLKYADGCKFTITGPLDKSSSWIIVRK